MSKQQHTITLTENQRNHFVKMTDFFERNKTLTESEEIIHSETSMLLLSTVGKENGLISKAYLIPELEEENEKLKKENQVLLLEHGRISDEISILGSRFHEINQSLHSIAKLSDYWEEEFTKELAKTKELEALLSKLKD